MHRQSTIRRLMIFGVVSLLGFALSTGVASAAPSSRGSGPDDTRAESGNAGQTSATKDCDGTHHSKTGHGANDAEPHAYNETCDGSPSGNGVGDGEANGKPCAGCVGNADDKNPPGQAPDGPTDHNAGYECDRNQGIGQTNPAHTGCTSAPADGGTGGNGGSTPPPEEPKGNGNGNGHGNGGGTNSTPPPAPPACPNGNAAGMAVGGSCTEETPASVLSSNVSREQGSTPDAVIGSALSATAGTAPVGPVIVNAPVDLVGLSSAKTASRPAEVLGVQIRRGAPSTLASTGATTVPLALLGAALLLAGFGLTSVRGRRGTSAA